VQIILKIININEVYIECKTRSDTVITGTNETVPKLFIKCPRSMDRKQDVKKTAENNHTGHFHWLKICP
jgi:hypothetical protein